jgi:hypothetical protein
MRTIGKMLARGFVAVWVAAAAFATITGAMTAAGAADGDTAASAFDTTPIKTEAPQGYCAFDPHASTSTGLITGFKPGLQGETALVAMFVPCSTLDRVKAGRTNWLPDWIAVETNTATKAGDDERLADTGGAVELLCKDAQTAHSKIAAETFTAKAAMAHAGLSAQKPIIYFGVVGEDAGVCYLSSLRLEKDSTGTSHRLLAVFAFVLAGNRWVYLSATRETDDASTAADVLYMAKSAVKDFMRVNP